MSSDSAPRVRKADAVAGSAHDRTRLTLGASAGARSTEPTGRARAAGRWIGDTRDEARDAGGQGTRTPPPSGFASKRRRIMSHCEPLVCSVSCAKLTRTVNAKPTLGSEAI